MRSNKPQDARNKALSARILPPAVLSYQQHLAAVRSLLPHRLSNTSELSSDLQKALNVDSLKPNPSKPDARLQLRAPVLSCDSQLSAAGRCVFSLPVALPVGMVVDLGPQVYRVKRATHSAGSTSPQSKAALAHTRGSLRDSSVPCFPSAFSFRDDITSCPERLDLDRRGLTDVPHLDSAENLRLLNMQHNLVSHLQDLLHLQRLVVLDLYDNRVIDMCGVSSLTSLRVLLLGKNRIQRICDVDGLTRLDVLDLHSNQISQIENVSRLWKLRLLNLSGNRITRVENLQGLTCLTELNLRHNSITSVVRNHTHATDSRIPERFNHPEIQDFTDWFSCSSAAPPISVCDLGGWIGVPVAVGCSIISLCLYLSVCLQTDVENLPRLQRLFLSANSISRFDALACLWTCRSLSELSVDGNPVALESCYRQTLLRCCSPHLQLLDMKRVTEEERRTASVSARKEEEKKKESHKQAAHKERRRLAIQNAAQQWEGLKACLELPAQNGSKEDISPEYSPAHSPAQTNGNTQETSPDEPRRLSPLTVSAGGNESRLRSASRPNSPRDPRKRQLQFLLDGRGRRSGQSPDDLKENGKQLGDTLSRALFSYPSRLSDSPEEAGADASERSEMVQQYLRGLIHRASAHCVKADALQKLWPSLFSEIVRDCVLEMRDRQAFRQTRLQRLHSQSQT